MSKEKKQPNPIDIHVGHRIRQQRNARNMTQQQLSKHIGVTFQQIQKYEKGTNRVSASRLQEISKILNVPVAFFYSNPEEDEAREQAMQNSGFAEVAAPFTDIACTAAEGNQLMHAFTRIRDPQIRRRIIDLAKALAENSPLI